MSKRLGNQLLSAKAPNEFSRLRGFCLCRLKTLDIFKSPDQVNQAIQDVASMLQVPSMLLGFSCASRGAVYGPLLVKEEADGEWMDCSMCANNIPGNSRAIASFSFQSAAK